MDGNSSMTTINHGAGNALLFPWKLHDMLRTCKTEGKESIVSWLPSGTAFKVHNVPVFVNNILPLFFKQTKYKSFQRQLNLWNFERIQNGNDKGAYYHPQFLREDPSLCRHLTRQRAKKASSGSSSNVGRQGTTVHTNSTASVTLSSLLSKKVTNKTHSSNQNSLIRPIQIPRKISEGSLNGVEGYHNILKRLNANDCDVPFDTAEFEGSTFHLLEQDRCEELNLVFKLNTTETYMNTKLLNELEQGVFGIPKV